MLSVDRIVKLTRQLYPNARPFKMPYGGILERLHAALAKSEARAYDDAYSVLNSAIADNPNFTEGDATDWERRLGIANGNGSTLPDRMMLINQKINYPGTAAPRQNYLFIQDQLRAAGFDVYVYENKFDDGAGNFITKTPEQIIDPANTGTVHSIGTQHGAGVYHGYINPVFTNKVVNHIEEEKDQYFIVGSNYRSTFFIAGSTITTFANVPASRKVAFRQLILQLKPVQTVGFLFINYT